MSIDLDRDVTINGHTFKAGKGVDTNISETDIDGKAVKRDYADGIKEVLTSVQNSEAAIEADSAVDPLEATKAMQGISQPNPVTEAASSTDRNASALELDDKGNAKEIKGTK